MIRFPALFNEEKPVSVFSSVLFSILKSPAIESTKLNPFIVDNAELLDRIKSPETDFRDKNGANLERRLLSVIRRSSTLDRAKKPSTLVSELFSSIVKSRGC